MVPRASEPVRKCTYDVESLWITLQNWRWALLLLGDIMNDASAWGIAFSIIVIR